MIDGCLKRYNNISITLWHTKYVSARLILGLNYYLVFMYLIQDIGLKDHVTLIPSIQYVSYYVKLIKWELLVSPGSVVSSLMR